MSTLRWDWSKFEGSELCLKWALRDLETLVLALQLVPRRRACIQAGGNLGIFPKRLAAEFDIVYSFEPDERLYGMMCRNAPESNIFKIRAALGADNAPVRMQCSRRDDSGRPVHEGLTHVAGPGDVPCFRIDDMNLSVCDLIYLDIEGWEYFALQGALKTIQRCRPVIGVEINRNIEYSGHTADELRALIKAQGYARELVSHSDEIYCPA
jgi:FkbM family methyltransferase